MQMYLTRRNVIVIYTKFMSIVNFEKNNIDQKTKGISFISAISSVNHLSSVSW